MRLDHILSDKVYLGMPMEICFRKNCRIFCSGYQHVSDNGLVILRYVAMCSNE